MITAQERSWLKTMLQHPSATDAFTPVTLDKLQTILKTQQSFDISEAFIEKARSIEKLDGNTADFIPIVCKNDLAVSADTYLRKGRRIFLDGRIQVRTYNDDQGNRRWVTEIVAKHIQYLDAPPEDVANGSNQGSRSNYNQGGNQGNGGGQRSSGNRGNYGNNGGSNRSNQGQGGGNRPSNNRGYQNNGSNSYGNGNRSANGGGTGNGNATGTGNGNSNGNGSNQRYGNNNSRSYGNNQGGNRSYSGAGTSGGSRGNSTGNGQMPWDQ